MEVHHHPDLHHKEKNFKEYFLEFLMIFLAVTLGFFAENLREKITDDNTLDNYMQSITADLQNDLVMYNNAIAFNNKHLKMIDSIIISVSQHLNNFGEIYYNARNLSLGTSIITPDSKTFDQMKSSNGFRLIRDQKISNSISGYYQWTNKFNYYSNLELQRLEDVLVANDKVFDAVAFFKIFKQLNAGVSESNIQSDTPALLSTDPKVINIFLMKYQYYYGNLSLLNKRISLASGEAKQLLELIKKNYHLK